MGWGERDPAAVLLVALPQSGQGGVGLAAARGTSRFFLGDNAQTARTNALPDAVRNAANSIASQLADGF